jgi:two-component system, NtrC family, response regulator AtoC
MKGLKILLVDDEPLMRLSMVDAFAAVGHDVETAASGTEGIATIRQRPLQRPKSSRPPQRS